MLGVNFDNVDWVMNNEVQSFQVFLRLKEKAFLNLGQDSSFMIKLNEDIYNDSLGFSYFKQELRKNENLTTLVNKLNEKGKKTPDGKTYILKKLLLKKGNYPNEKALLNGIIFSILTTDLIYTYFEPD